MNNISIYENWFILTLILLSIIIYFPISLILDKCKNSNNKKIIFIKISISLSCICALVWIASYFYVRIKNNSIEMAENNIVSHISMLAFLTLSIPGILMFMFGNIKPPKPDKYLLKQDNYLDFSNYLNKRVLLNDYQEVYSEENLRIYKKIIKKNKHYIINFKTEEFTEDIYNDLYDNKMIPIMEKDLKEMQNRMYRSLYVTYIISVDRLTTYFSEFIKGLEQDIRYFSLPVGISFGGKKIYIAAEIKEFEMIELKRMKKEVKMILEVENKKIKHNKIS